ncbi:MAG TPA: hypothetical protein VIK28_09875 [Sedimentisphaerales bacterium]
MHWYHYHPILAIVPTFPEILWQAFLTILGAAIGAAVAGWIAMRLERKRELERAKDEFVITIRPMLLTIEKDTALASFRRMKMDAVRSACNKLWVRVDAQSRRELDAAVDEYCQIDNNRLEGVQRRPDGGGTIEDYSVARETLAAPLKRMLNIAASSTYS